MAANIIIRPVELNDADDIARLWKELVMYHQALDSALPGFVPDGPRRYARQMMQRLQDPQTRALAAVYDGRVVGFVLGMVIDLMPDIFQQEPAGFLADIYVEAPYRRQGVGRMLVEHLKEWFQAEGLAYFDWHVAANNPAGVAFWRSIGGREVMIRMRAELGEEK